MELENILFLSIQSNNFLVSDEELKDKLMRLRRGSQIELRMDEIMRIARAHNLHK